MIALSKLRRIAMAVAVVAMIPVAADAEYPINYELSAIANTGSGNFAPYYIASGNHGILTQTHDAMARVSVWRPIDKSQRFSYAFGVDFLNAYSSKTDYSRYDVETGQWGVNPQRPAQIWLQQLYVQLKFRGVQLTVGMREYESGILNNQLSSGDFTFSGNTRPIPGFRVGFIDFQNIPFTNGWVQLQGEIGYGLSTDKDWVLNHFNYYTGRVNTGWWYNYKRWYFRTKPSMPFSVTVGLQAAAQFCGHFRYYHKGKLAKDETEKPTIWDFVSMLVPRGGELYWFGNHLGSWDLKARYRLRNGDEIYGYFQWPWEDGSGIGKQNGFDGMWGIEYKRSKPGLVTGVVLEYLDFTNQSGPMHWDPDDEDHTTITDAVTGNDSYYVNFHQTGYSLYGMSIGTPFIKSPLYNLDGNPNFMCNRIRGFHAAITGNITPQADYTMKLSYRKGWGTYVNPLPVPLQDVSMLFGVNWHSARIKGLTVKGQAAIDLGSMYGNNYGVMLSVSYSGILKLGKK